MRDITSLRLVPTGVQCENGQSRLSVKKHTPAMLSNLIMLSKLLVKDDAQIFDFVDKYNMI
jgi:hypothetical protein